MGVRGKKISPEKIWTPQTYICAFKVFGGHKNWITIALKACQWAVAYIICQADNRFLNMRMRINVEMNDPHMEMQNVSAYC